MHDREIKIKRGTSTGFILEEEASLDDFQMLNSRNSAEIRRSKMKRNKTGDSSKYSFDSENSELDNIYDQLDKWLNDPLDSRDRKLDARDKAVLKIADSLLKRALSESFLGEPIDENILEDMATSTEDYNTLTTQQKRKIIRNFRSLSLEVAKHKNLLTSSMVSEK